MSDLSRFPQLTTTFEATWGDRQVWGTFAEGAPGPATIGSVRMICFIGDDLVIARSREFGLMPMPGGTLEPDEEPLRALERELLEEIGARIVNYHVFGHVRFRTDAAEPYRPHLPHPEWTWLLGFGDVEIVGPPVTAETGETIEEVLVVPMDEALRLLASEGRDWDAAIIGYALDVRSRLRSGG